MSIRPANTSDFERILNFCKELSSNFDDAILQGSFPNLMIDKNAAVFIAESEIEAAGFIEIHIQHSLQSGRHAMIRALFVSEKYRRAGYAKALVEYAEKWAIDQGADKILVQSKTERVVADKFYSRIGYVNFKVQNVYKKALIT